MLLENCIDLGHLPVGGGGSGSSQPRQPVSPTASHLLCSVFGPYALLGSSSSSSTRSIIHDHYSTDPIRSDAEQGVQFRSELKSYHFDSLRQWLVWWVTPSPPPSPSPSPSPSLSVAFFWDSDSDSDLDSRHLLNLFLFSFH